jgi:tetratricopeptide (TPR) repeat protein
VGSGDEPGDVKVGFRLYEAKGNRFIVDEVSSIQFAGPEGPTAEALNSLINAACTLFLRAMLGEQAETPSASFSNSLTAMKQVLKAHQTTATADKIALYEAALDADPQLETAYHHLARLYKTEGDYEKSVMYYRKSLEVSNGSQRNRAIQATDAGILCALLGKTDFALQWWLRAIDYDPGYINPHFNIANTYEDQDRFAEAEQYFLKAQQLAPDDFRTFFNLARIYSKMGAWDKALSQYRHQLHTEDGDPWCHSDVATCYLNLGDMGNARIHLEKTLALDPDGEAGQYAQLILGGIG